VARHAICPTPHHVVCRNPGKEVDMLMRATGVALALVMTACSSVTPVPLRGGEVCYRCRRLILDTRVAAQTVGTLATNFRTAGCLAKYLAAHPEETNAVFVTDYESGKLMPASSGAFVPTTDPNTGEEDFVVYRKNAAAAKQTPALTWAEVLDQAKAATSAN
jgi:hypothetical protein